MYNLINNYYCCHRAGTICKIYDGRYRENKKKCSPGSSHWVLNMLQPVTGQTWSPGPPPTPSYSKPAILQKCKKALFIWIFNFLKLKYPPRLIESTINSFIHSQDQAEPQHQIPLELSCCSKIRGRSTLYKKISAENWKRFVPRIFQ